MNNTTLFNRVFTEGDAIIYHKKDAEHHGIYVSHRSFSTWHNRICFPNTRHSITIIDKDGKKDIVDFIKPLKPNQ